MVREAALQCLRRLAAHGNADALTNAEGLRTTVGASLELGPGKKLAEDAFRGRAASARWLANHGHKHNAITSTLYRSIPEETFGGLIIRRRGQTLPRGETHQLPSVRGCHGKLKCMWQD